MRKQFINQKERNGAEFFLMFKEWFIGRPLHNQEASGEKLPKWKALPIFSSDALSSVGYGPEQIALVLALAGPALYGYFGYVSLAVILLLGIVALSYVQVARANPGGGGSYSIAKTYLGETPALVVAAALFTDYTLTVAVSISSGTAAFISAFPALVGHEVLLDLIVLFGLLTLMNLRGIRESANLFVWPTYLFIGAIALTVLVGLGQVLMGSGEAIPTASTTRATMDSAVLLVLLRAFASGCSSMTGVEAISNGVPMFREPSAKNAITTTWIMAGILASMLGGISFLILHFHILPEINVTVLSKVAEQIFGRTLPYYFVQITTMLILYIAANTSYNGLPSLMAIISRDGYLPRYLGLRGDRLSFSNGIILLSIIAGLLIVIFEGNVEHLIALYALGVFISFTIAQASLVKKWHQEKPVGWHYRLGINLFGAIVTGGVVLIIGISKFIYGVWAVFLFIPLMVYIFKKIHCHYQDVAEQLHLPMDAPLTIATRNIVIIPVASPTAAVAYTLKYAKSISSEVLAINVAIDPDEGERIQQKWQDWDPEIQLITLYSPYRMVIQPLLDYIDDLETRKEANDFITVLIPEFEPRSWWQRLLHNQTGWLLHFQLILRKNVVVITVPYHLEK